MDKSFIDLDISLLKVRDPQSRRYFSDAIKAYRSGALRAAVTAAWVAVAYDLVAKIRELSEGGDAEARRLIGDWDRARENNNTSRLLELERELIKVCAENLQLFNPMDRRQLERLLEDRHICAHPAFSSDAELFEPTSELVRMHLSTALEIVLTQLPIQGRVIFEEFSRDVVSPGFPAERDKAINYFERRYLERTRPSLLSNFAIVLAKGILRDVPPEWQNAKDKILNCLVAIHERRSASWQNIEPSIVGLIENLEPEHRYNAFRIIAAVPGLAERLSQQIIDVLNQCIMDAEANTPDDFSFVRAANIEAFREQTLRTLAALSDESLAKAVSVAPVSDIWPLALGKFANSGSYRNAESNFDEFIAPFAGSLNQTQIEEMLVAIGENGQIYFAAGIAKRLKGVLDAQADQPSLDAWTEFYKAVYRYNERYEEIWQQLEARGWPRPEIAE